MTLFREARWRGVLRVGYRDDLKSMSLKRNWFVELSCGDDQRGSKELVSTWWIKEFVAAGSKAF